MAGIAQKAHLVLVAPCVAAAAVGAAIDHIVAFATLQVITIAATDQHIVAGVAAHLVIVGCAGNAAGGGITSNDVVKHGALGIGADAPLWVGPF